MPLACLLTSLNQSSVFWLSNDNFRPIQINKAAMYKFLHEKDWQGANNAYPWTFLHPSCTYKPTRTRICTHTHSLVLKMSELSLNTLFDFSFPTYHSSCFLILHSHFLLSSILLPLLSPGMLIYDCRSVWACLSSPPWCSFYGNCDCSFAFSEWKKMI